jgi:hypothetical protein
MNAFSQEDTALSFTQQRFGISAFLEECEVTQIPKKYNSDSIL